MEFSLIRDWTELIQFIDGGKGTEVTIKFERGSSTVQTEMSSINYALEIRDSLYRLEYLCAYNSFRHTYVFSIRETDLRDLCGI